MRIKFLGTGSAFTLKNYQTNLAIEHNGKWLLLDAGGDIRFSMRDAGLSYKDIDAVYISHLHADHSNGIEYLGFCTYFDPSVKEKIKLFGNGELLRRGWEDTWKGGLESVQGKLLSLDDFFKVKPVKPNGHFEWEGLKFSIVQSIHIMNGYSLALCYGLMIDVPGENPSRKGSRVFWTADCQFCPSQIMNFYKQADYIIQDCETTPFKSGVHANFLDLVTLPADIKKKMILVHYQDNVLSSLRGTDFSHSDVCLLSPEWRQKTVDDGFIGFAERLQEVSF